MNRFYKKECWIKLARVMMFFAFLGFKMVVAQTKITNKYGLVIIKSTKILQKETHNNPDKKMIDIRSFIPNIVLDLKYSTDQNFMHQRLYPAITTTFLRKPAAEKLKKIVDELKSQNLNLKIFDAYRPYSITEKMWAKVKDDRYAADPAKGSGHNRGGAVDLTLIDATTGKELPMGTGFDNFSDTAHSDFKNLSPEILKNRDLLKTIMEKYGFKQLSTEWWHFYLPNSSSFELLDISFAGLKKLAGKD